MASQYENPRLWKRVGSAIGLRYASVPTDEPTGWTRGRLAERPEVITYVAGEYEIQGRPYGRRRSWTVWRQGVELPLSLTGSLREAQKRAQSNARGEDRINVV